jgi:hypothetical protein
LRAWGHYRTVCGLLAFRYLGSTSGLAARLVLFNAPIGRLLGLQAGL